MLQRKITDFKVLAFNFLLMLVNVLISLGENFVFMLYSAKRILMSEVTPGKLHKIIDIN